ncbi:magnesium transporter [Candidatus Jorgensenbacteria bacterium]|nr:magnesium transporter [Candidatus Jorgensenbacteria bacterium]
MDIRHTVGQYVETKVPIVEPSSTIGTIEQLLLERASDFETISYIYVVDNKGVLVGIVSIKEVFGIKKDVLVRNVMKQQLVIAHPSTHPERVATLAIKYNLKAIPIADRENKFLGVIPSDAILNILHREHTEAFLRSAGIHPFKDSVRDVVGGSVISHFKKRLPWLLIGLVGGVLAAAVVEFFETALTQMIILASFIPAVVYIADAVGVQSQTIFIRNLVLEHKVSLLPYLKREIGVGLLIAVVLGVLIAVFSMVFWYNPVLSFVLGLSFFLAIITAVIVGVFLPWILWKMGRDPVFGAGPFATVIRDIASLFIYFMIASISFKVFL